MYGESNVSYCLRATFIETGSLFAWAGSMMHKTGKETAYIMLNETFVRQKK
jgi:hypothetical protein